MGQVTQYPSVFNNGLSSNPTGAELSNWYFNNGQNVNSGGLAYSNYGTNNSNTINTQTMKMNGTPVTNETMQAYTKALNNTNEFNNSWIGGKGLSALQGVGNLVNMYLGYKSYKDAKKTSALQREIARYNLNQSKQEYGRLQNKRKTLTASWNR